MRHPYKSWQNKRPGWTRRVIWYEDDNSIRLKFEDEYGRCSRFYDTVDEAQVEYDEFRDGKLTTFKIMSGTYGV